MQSTFATNVYHIASKIPKGKVATYKQLATLAGKPKAARAVGMLMKHNPDKTIVPCHRVVGSNGKLTGYTFGNGIQAKKLLLKEEGVDFTKNNVNLTTSLWKTN